MVMNEMKTSGFALLYALLYPAYLAATASIETPPVVHALRKSGMTSRLILEAGADVNRIYDVGNMNFYAEVCSCL